MSMTRNDVPENVDAIPELPRYTAEELDALNRGEISEKITAGLEKPAIEPTPAPVPQESPAEIIAKKDKALEDARIFNERRGTEIGDLRKENAEFKRIANELAAELRNREQGKELSPEEQAEFFANPHAAVRKVVQEEKRTIEQQEQTRAEIVKENQATLKEWNPDFNADLVRKAILLDVKDEQAADNYIKESLFLSPPVTHLLHRVGRFMSEIEALKQENETLKKNTGNVLARVAQTARVPRGTSTGSDPVGPANAVPELQSKEELDAFLRQFRKMKG